MRHLFRSPALLTLPPLTLPTPTFDIGLFGGSFDPPHLGHLLIAETMREQFELTQVWWIPAARPPHKTDRTLVPGAHRLAMVQKAIADNPAFVVKDVELHRSGPSYTVDTVQTLQEEHPDTRFALLLGGDSLVDFFTWHEPKEIVRRVPLLVYKRPQVRFPALPPWLRDRVHIAEASLIDISSTDVRQRCQEGRSIRYRVTESVRTYIESHNLYRE